MTCQVCVHTNDKHYTNREALSANTLNEKTRPEPNALGKTIWDTDTIYWRRDSSYRFISDKTLDELIKFAFLESGLKTRLRFKQKKRGDAHIIINFLGKKDEPYFTSPSTLAFGYGPGAGKGGNITMNADVLWLLRKTPLKAIEAKSLGYIENFSNPDNEIKFFDPLHTLKHEGGHAVGMNHITDLTQRFKSIMFPYYNGLREFGEADTAYLQSLYGKASINKIISDEITKRINSF